MITRLFALLSHNLIPTLLGVLGLTFLVALHEFGHYLFCKLFKINTPTFSIGMGPQLISKRIGGTNFAISAIPLGGYVEIAGLAEIGQGEQKEAHRADAHSFTRKPYWQKLLVMVGGIGFNLIFTYLIITLLFIVGFPKTPLLYPLNGNTTLKAISSESPAAGKLQPGDIILAVNGKELDNSALAFKEAVSNYANQEVTLTVEHEGSQFTLPVTLSSTQDAHDKKVGMLGVEFEMGDLKAPSIGQAISRGFTFTNKMICNIFNAFLHIFAKGDISSMGGPVQIIRTTVHGAHQSLWLFLFILAMISVNLAVLNLIPLPILDGGQILYFTIEAIVGRPLPLKVREGIHLVTWIAVLGLIIYLSGQDIYRLIKPWLMRSTN